MTTQTIEKYEIVQTEPNGAITHIGPYYDRKIAGAELIEMRNRFNRYGMTFEIAVLS